VTGAIIHERSKLSIFAQAIRAFSLVASVIPVLVGSALALYYPGKVYWYLLPIIIICSMLFQSATNILNDYYDYKKGVDKEYTYGSSRVLVDKILTPKQLLTMGIIVMLTGFILGLSLVYVRGLPMLIIGVVGALGGYLYSGYPMGYKYFALGDIMVFALMGPFMVIGAFFALTGSYMSELWIMSIPVGCLVLSILQANNHRDIINDKAAKIKTVSIILGHKASKVEYLVLVAGAYLSVFVMILFKLVTPFAALIVVAMPIAIKNMRMIKNSNPEKASEIAILDVLSAQHHMIFGVLYSIGISLGYFL
jgi:1,4-dihydroxy-2-naphthoate octaprenyltransferase